MIKPNFNLKKLFEQVNFINDMIEADLLEISVKRHQITLMFDNKMMSVNTINSLLSMCNKETEEQSFLASDNESFYFTIGNLSLDDIDKKNVFYPFLYVIDQMANKICTCPALEFIISSQYMKCFLDKPGLKASDLLEYEKILDAKGLGELELHPQRPYLLFLNIEEE